MWTKRGTLALPCELLHGTCFEGAETAFQSSSVPHEIFTTSSMASSHCIWKNTRNRSLLEKEWTRPQFAIIYLASWSELTPPSKCSGELSLGSLVLCFPSSSPGTKSWHQENFRGRVCFTVRGKKKQQKWEATNFGHCFQLLVLHYLFFTLSKYSSKY